MTLQNQIADLQQQLNNANQAENNLSKHNTFRARKCDIFSGRNVFRWFK